ncbi:MAG: C25 family cysteine peptidase [Planctomycetota bacterium]|nr:C25 family cysteine peptidase [Planctomycetota bacterium]
MLCWILLLSLLSPNVPTERVLFLVPLAASASWQDDAFLAAIPAACVLGNGEPMVLAVDRHTPWSPEVLDFLIRYAPDKLYWIGEEQPPQLTGDFCEVEFLEADSAVAAALAMSNLACKQSEGVVLYDPQEPGAGLTASALAARLHWPLFPWGEGDAEKSVQESFQNLQVQSALFVGKGTPPKLEAFEVEHLVDAFAVTQWLIKEGLAVEYLAVVHPSLEEGRRNQTLALAAPLLAAGRKGVVVPLPFAVQWKQKYTASQPVDGVAEGVLPLEKKAIPFRLGKDATSGKWYAQLDRNRDGQFKGKQEPKLFTGDVIEIAKIKWTVNLDAVEAERGLALWLTSPTTEQIQGEIQRFSAATKQQAEYLCIVGWPEAIPMPIIADGQGIDADLVSDLPYAQTDEDPFLELAHARFLTTDLTSATLLACRGFARDDFPDRSWDQTYATAEWETASRASMQVTGLQFLGHHNGDAPMEQESPLTHSAAIVHGSHAAWTVLGNTYSWDTATLLAPAVVDSAGCSTASLDQDLEHRSVAAQLLRNGAVAFIGNTRRGIAEQDLFRSEIWNGLLDGMTIGKAQRKALNRTLVAVLEKEQTAGGAYFYQHYNHMVIGDPALQLHFKRTESSEAASASIDGRKVTVLAPKRWIRFNYIPLEEWGCEFPILYSWRGAGVGVESTWHGPEKRNDEHYFYTVEVKTRSKLSSVKLVGKTTDPLGVSGPCFVDFHADGSRSLFWRVRLFDADMTSGEIRSQAQELKFLLSK